jgi:hypothetical protein
MSKFIGLRSSYLVLFVFLLALFGFVHVEEHFDVNTDLKYGVIFNSFSVSLFKDSE